MLILIHSFYKVYYTNFCIILHNNIKTRRKIMAIWKARTKDGKEISELDSSWADVQDEISELIMITNSHQTIKLPKNMNKYIQAKTASAELGSNNIQIESRYLGFELGNNTVIIRVDEKTQNISVEIQ